MKSVESQPNQTVGGCGLALPKPLGSTFGFAMPACKRGATDSVVEGPPSTDVGSSLLSVLLCEPTPLCVTPSHHFWPLAGQGFAPCSARQTIVLPGQTLVLPGQTLVLHVHNFASALTCCRLPPLCPAFPVHSIRPWHWPSPRVSRCCLRSSQTSPTGKREESCTVGSVSLGNLCAGPSRASGFSRLKAKGKEVEQHQAESKQQEGFRV